MRILITGANRGIGAVLDQKLAAAGHEVLGCARNHSEYLQLDVSKPQEFRDLAAKLDGRPLDLVVCNAGIYHDKGMNLADGFAPDVWADTFAVNVTGVFLTVQTLLPNLQRSAEPKVAIISSQMGSNTRAAGSSYIYRASKAAATNLGRNLAVDLAHLGIAVGMYHPGWVQTDMGGGHAAITSDASATGLIDRFAALSMDTTGVVEMWNGEPLPF